VTLWALAVLRALTPELWNMLIDGIGRSPVDSLDEVA
jgi:hypothetical protein